VAGALSSVVVVGMTATSILGKYKWVNKAVGYADRGSSSSAACEQKRGVGFADQESCEVGLAPQTKSLVAPGCLSGPDEAGIMPAITILVPNAFGNLLGVSAGEVIPRNLLQSLIEGGSLMEEAIPGTEVNLLVPESLCTSDLDREGPSSQGVDGLSPIADMSFDELCATRTEGEGASVLALQTSSPGLHLVPYVEEEPIPLDWCQTLVGGEFGGSQAADKEVELIMAVIRIMGVSCDGHFERLRAAFALILVGRVNRGDKKPMGGS
jgi:hypothetical protein